MHKPIALFAAAIVVVALSAAAAQTETPAPAPAQESAEREAPPPSDARVVDMERRCAGRREMRFYPQRALERRLGGQALMECGFNADGEVQTCQVVEESPLDYGFGDAALSIACNTNFLRPNSQARTFTREGSDLTYRRWPVRFQLEGQRPQPEGQ
jgi:TonB family protein